MPKLPGINHQRAVKALQKAGFMVDRESKHIFMSKGPIKAFHSLLPLISCEMPGLHFDTCGELVESASSHSARQSIWPKKLSRQPRTSGWTRKHWLRKYSGA